MKVLVACEFSGVVREAFRKRGHDAWSCDVLEAEDNSPYHIQDDVLNIIGKGGKGIEWDLMIAHPPCTYLTVAANKWLYHPEDKDLPTDQRRPHPKYPDRKQDMLKGAEFFMKLYNSDIPRVAVEQPKSRMSTFFRKPDQILQPWMFGHGEVKGICLWLKGLPLLQPENIVSGREERVFMMGPSKDRWKERSRTYPGFAEAMANQWSF